VARPEMGRGSKRLKLGFKPEMGPGSKKVRTSFTPQMGQGSRTVKGGGRRGPAPGPYRGIPKALQLPGKLGRAVGGKDASSLKLNVRGLQYFLRNKGYNIKADGKLGPLTKQALKDAIVSGTIKNASAAQMNAVKGVRGGNIGPKAFNDMVAKAGTTPYRPLIGKGAKGMVKPNGSLGNPGPSGKGGGGQGSVNPSATNKALKASTGQDIPQSDANFGQLFNVDKTATAMGQEQFQPQINDQQLIVNRDPRQAAQNEKDVKDWYNQVLGAQHAAGQQDQAATSAGVNATDAQTKALIQSLGGSANQGSGEAAAAGQNASGTLQAIGASQQGLDSELAPILQAQAAQQRTDQSNIDQAKLQGDQQTLQNLQGQEGNAETSAQMQLQSANNSLDQARQQALQNILEYNNSLSQQKYQNQLGMMSAQIAAAMNGVTMGKDQAEANYYNAKGQAALSGGGGARSASQINDIQRSLLGALGSKGLIISPSAGVYKLAPGVTPDQVLKFGQQFDSGYGSLPGNFLPSALSGIQGY
jgi:hypothetical protein